MNARRLLTSALLAIGLAGGLVHASDEPNHVSTPGPELVAVENLVFADAWHAAGHTDPPTFHGVPFDAMADDPNTSLDEAHMFEPHFDRHVWIYRENPNGVFTPLNPAVTCAAHHAAGTHSHHGGSD